jgi:hypothetical protein
VQHDPDAEQLPAAADLLAGPLDSADPLLQPVQAFAMRSQPTV